MRYIFLKVKSHKKAFLQETSPPPQINSLFSVKWDYKQNIGEIACLYNTQGGKTDAPKVGISPYIVSEII